MAITTDNVVSNRGERIATSSRSIALGRLVTNCNRGERIATEISRILPECSNTCNGGEKIATALRMPLELHRFRCNRGRGYDVFSHPYTTGGKVSRCSSLYIGGGSLDDPLILRAGGCVLSALVYKGFILQNWC